MKTNEATKRELLTHAEQAVEDLLESLEDLKDGDLNQLEQQIFQTVLELGRKGMETLLKQAAAEKPSEPGTDPCGHALKVVGSRDKQVQTLMGPLTVRRAYYHCQESKAGTGEEQRLPPCPGSAPFDRTWGLGQQRCSPGVQRLVSALSARLTHCEVAEAVNQLLLLKLSARQVGNIRQPVGEAFVHREEHQVLSMVAQGAQKHRSQAEELEEQAEPVRRLYVELDGVMARLRRGSVAMETHERERQGDVYREIKVGAVFVGEPGRERSELCPGVFVDQPGPIRYVARRATAEEFAAYLYALARSAGAQRAKQVVVLADGAKWIWNLAQDQFPGAIEIVDEYHARQHIWEVARAAFAAEPDLRESWAHQVIDRLSQGQVEEVIAAIEHLPQMAPDPGKAHSVQETEAEYFRRNMHRMRYPAFRAQGMHLGSGIARSRM